MMNFTAVESIFFAALEMSAGPERAAFVTLGTLDRTGEPRTIRLQRG